MGGVQQLASSTFIPLDTANCDAITQQFLFISLFTQYGVQRVKDNTRKKETHRCVWISRGYYDTIDPCSIPPELKLKNSKKKIA